MPDLTVAGESTTTAYTLSLAPLSVAIPAGAVVYFRLPAVITAGSDVKCQALKWNKKVSALTVSLPANNGGFTESTTVALTFKSAVERITDAPFRIRCTGLTVPAAPFEGSLENIVVHNADGKPVAQIPLIFVPAVTSEKQGTSVVMQTLRIISDTMLSKPLINAARLEYQRRIPGSDFSAVAIKSQKLVYTGSVDTSQKELDNAAQHGTPTHVELELAFELSPTVTQGEVKALLAAKEDEINQAVSNSVGKPVLSTSALRTAVVPASCSNGVADGAETGPDCGGGAASGCYACDTLQPCTEGADCLSGTCDANGTCSKANSAVIASSTTTALVATAIALTLFFV